MSGGREKGLQMLRLLHMHINVILDYKKKNKLNKSESPLGFLYWLTDDEQELVKTFENEHQGCQVYHVVKTLTVDFGCVYDLLYVDEDEEFIRNAKEHLKDNLVLSYTVTEFPESGFISIKSVNGGIVRNY